MYPTAAMVAPVAMMAGAPNRSVARAANKFAGSAAPIIGRKARPVARGGRPLICWKYRLGTKMRP